MTVSPCWPSSLIAGSPELAKLIGGQLVAIYQLVSENTVRVAGSWNDGATRGFSVDAESRSNGQQRNTDCGNIAVAAHFRNEAAARLESPEYSAHDRVLITHPVKCGIRKDGIEL